MPNVKELRDELRELRKSTGARPISKMKKEDISKEIERMSVHRETTPSVASVPSAPLKKSVSAVETIKEAKRGQFPVKPEEVRPVKSKAVGKKAAEAPAAPAEKKKMGKKDMMMKLMAMMDDDE